MITLSHDFALSKLSNDNLPNDIDDIADKNAGAFYKRLERFDSLLPFPGWDVVWEQYYNAFSCIYLYLKYLASDSDASEELEIAFESVVASVIQEWNGGEFYPKEPTYHKIYSHLPKWVIDLTLNYEGWDEKFDSTLESWWCENCPVNRAIFEHNNGQFDGLVLPAGSEYPSGYQGEIIEVSDHGNATLFYISLDGHVKEIDSVV